jgi:hypothetical protein
MLEAAEANGSRVTKMVVSRPVCPDCREALRDYRRGSVDVREMPFRMPGPPSTSAKVAAMAPLVVQGVNIVLNYLIGGENADAIRAALDRIRPEIKAAQAARPTSGHLLIFRYRTAGEGVTPKFESVAQREGYTQDEAKERWANSPDYAREPENTFEFSWIPPVVQPPAVVLATPWPKVAIAQFADQSRLQFQKAQFSQLGGFGARGRTKTYDMHTLAKFQFAVLEIPKTLTYVNPADKLANKDVGVGQRDVAGGRLPVIMLDSDTPAVTVWPVDDLTHGLFTAAGKMGGRLDDKVGALRHHVGVDLVRWLPPEQVRAINML